MKIGIYSAQNNGPVRDKSIPYIAADQGYTHLINQGIRPLVAIGDFDSIDQLPDDVEILTYPTHKDESDTELAVRYAIDHGYDEIDIYGATGGRLDHFIAALMLLSYYNDVKITILDERNKIQRLESGIHELDIDQDGYFSLFAIEDTFLSLKGCVYEVSDYHLKRHDPLCLSNRATGMVTIKTSQPLLLVEAK